MRAIAFVFPLLCVGCAHVHYGSSVNGASVQVNGGNALGVVLLGGMLATGAVEDFREPQPTYPTFSDWFWNRPAPPLAADRPVSEQDCRKPVELSGNLRCQ
jgi:hypothetical protein